MSFHLAEVFKLQAAGGAVLRKYGRLVAEAEGAMHGSPAAMAKVRFEQAWVADPEATKAQAEAEENPPKRRGRKPRAEVEPEPEPDREPEPEPEPEDEED